MPVHFNWRTDDEAADQPSGAPAGAGQGRRRLLWAALTLATIIAALLTWQFRRAQRQEELIEADVGAGYQVWLQAVLRNDLELFLSQLSDGNSAWQDAQQQLFLQQRLLNRQEFGLTYTSGSGGQVAAVDVAPEWQTARLFADYTYTADEGQSVTLQQTYVYRRHDNRWLLTPPTDQFWGNQQSVSRPGLVASYPQRDAQLVERLLRDLDSDLHQRCAERQPDIASCLSDLNLKLRFGTDPLLLGPFRDPYTPFFRDGEFLLPSPTLVGIPRDEASYDALYRGYMARVLELAGEAISPSADPPRQDLLSLCQPRSDQRLRLFRYDPDEDEWSNELPGRSFRFLMSVPGGDGAILQTESRGMSAPRMHVLWWRKGQVQTLFNQEVHQPLTRPTGWAASAQPRLLLQSISENRRILRRWIDLNRCQTSGCEPVELAGFTTWSPGGEHSLVVQGTDVWRGDEEGRPLLPLGTGLSPFWLDNEVYGLVRFDRQAGPPSMQVITATTSTDLPHIVLPVGDLARRVEATDPPLLYINHVAPNPVDPDLLLLSATTVGASGAKHLIFSLRLSSGRVRLLQQYERAASGDPALLTPAGFPPFRFSPDGRWLLVTVAVQPSPVTWRFILYDLEEHVSRQVTTNYPAYPARFPYYDWSSDGRRLAIVEDGFVRILAPQGDYRRVVAHDMQACYFAAWVNDE